jgi:RimJ/RimL family protein N-acetyltransferase
MSDSQTYTSIFSFQLKPVILEGSHLRLEPLSEGHLEELVSLFDVEIWRWYTDQINTCDALRSFLQKVLEEQSLGRTLAFAIREKKSERLVGSSRFMNVSPVHRKVEIGSTWYGRSWQRTFANTESKYLMLSHAFDSLSCISVQFQTDVLNEKSKAAIERLGAKLEGVHRNDRICFDGRIRDSVYYSITQSEWPEVKQRLFTRLNS